MRRAALHHGRDDEQIALSFATLNERRFAGRPATSPAGQLRSAEATSAGAGSNRRLCDPDLRGAGPGGYKDNLLAVRRVPGQLSGRVDAIKRCGTPSGRRWDGFRPARCSVMQIRGSRPGGALASSVGSHDPRSTGAAWSFEQPETGMDRSSRRLDSANTYSDVACVMRPDRACSQPAIAGEAFRFRGSRIVARQRQ